MDFKSGDYNFRIEKLNAFEQLHLSRKIAPLLPALAPILMRWRARKGDLLSTQILEIAELAEPFAVALADMKDVDAEQVLMTALSKVKVQTDVSRDVWMPVFAPGTHMTSVAELNDLGKLLPVAIKSIMFNLGNFMDGLLTRREEKSPTSSGAVSPVAKTG